MEWSVLIATYRNGRGLVNDHELRVHVHHGDMVRCHGDFMPVTNGEQVQLLHTSQSDTTQHAHRLIMSLNVKKKTHYII
jgi:hypothetical protein